MEYKTLEELAQINPDSIKKDYPYDEIDIGSSPSRVGKL
jgi:hypothetical protein